MLSASRMTMHEIMLRLLLRLSRAASSFTIYKTPTPLVQVKDYISIHITDSPATSLFERILVALDGSDHSMHALKSAIQIAKNFRANLALINVYSFTQPVDPMSLSMTGRVRPLVLTPTGSIPSEVFSKLAEAHRQAGANILANGKEKAQAEGIQAETLLKEGHAVEQILRTASEGRYDLIVIGARGLSTIKEILLGSVSHGVVIHASCPVLVVK